jgi:hypothetical protein
VAEAFQVGIGKFLAIVHQPWIEVNEERAITWSAYHAIYVDVRVIAVGIIPRSVWAVLRHPVESVHDQFDTKMEVLRMLFHGCLPSLTAFIALVHRP